MSSAPGQTPRPNSTEKGSKTPVAEQTPPVPDSSIEKARLMQTLITSALITPEEIDNCRKHYESDGAAGRPTDFLDYLVAEGNLTKNQAVRVAELYAGPTAKQPIPGYKLKEKLGQGAMGTVYRARQLSMNRLVAVKILQPRLAKVPGYISRFIREAHMAAQLSSNNIVQAIDVGSAGSIHYFIMEYVEGKTIQDALNTGKVFIEKKAVEIVLQVAKALEHAHKRGLVHRDVKPANIIITKDGVVKLADLGIARHVEDHKVAQAEKGKTIGTPYYIAPELIQGRLEADIRADIYSLGATMYHMVTGRPPFVSNDVQEVIKARLTQDLVPPDHLNTNLSAGLGEVAEFMMARDREDRYVDPSELIVDLESLARGHSPKLASLRAAALRFEGLSEGDEEEIQAAQPSSRTLWIALIFLGGMLAISAIFNLVLLANLLNV